MSRYHGDLAERPTVGCVYNCAENKKGDFGRNVYFEKCAKEMLWLDRITFVLVMFRLFGFYEEGLPPCPVYVLFFIRNGDFCFCTKGGNRFWECSVKNGMKLKKKQVIAQVRAFCYIYQQEDKIRKGQFELYICELEGLSDDKTLHSSIRPGFTTLESCKTFRKHLSSVLTFSSTVGCRMTWYCGKS